MVQQATKQLKVLGSSDLPSDSEGEGDVSVNAGDEGDEMGRGAPAVLGLPPPGLTDDAYNHPSRRLTASRRSELQSMHGSSEDTLWASIAHLADKLTSTARTDSDDVGERIARQLTAAARSLLRQAFSKA